VNDFCVESLIISSQKGHFDIGIPVKMKVQYSLMLWLHIFDINRPISEGAGRISVAKYDRIKTFWTRNQEGEEGQGGVVRKFEFDFGYYTSCKL
jgi:hypothetical protein